jgi:hypothetical protein
MILVLRLCSWALKASGIFSSSRMFDKPNVTREVNSALRQILAHMRFPENALNRQSLYDVSVKPYRNPKALKFSPKSCVDAVKLVKSMLVALRYAVP